ncbi:MAG: hypothetical protein ABI606_15645 [Rhodoferax sp.]
MDFAQITPYLVAANIVLTWGLGFYVHLTSKNKAITDRLDVMDNDIKSDLGGHAERLARLESHHASAPTHADLAKVYDKLNRVAESCSRMEGQIDGMDSTLRLMLSRIAEKGLS